MRRPSWLLAYVACYVAFLYGPILLIPLFSFNAAPQASFPLRGFTTEWYRVLWSDGRFVEALGNTMMVGLTAAGLATLIGTAAAYAEIGRPNRASAVVSALLRLPILIPGVIIGIALLILVNLAGLGPSRGSIVLGHTVLALPATIVVMRASFAALPGNLAEAAMDLGAREWDTFHRIMLPLSLPAMVSSFTLAFLTSFDEFIVAFFLAGTQPTLPLFIWSQLRFPKSLPSVMALGSLILLASVLLAAAAELIRRRGAAHAAGRAAPAPLVPQT
ncbi:ABC transporter permease [Lichenihabitans sp. Uapishka_5]|uniref:ABC transporter permease n=1 Tax=Lichenihabitans sp. Uapishka_5 TaxID=3037302 RepID=UPI0029E82126|nr:ABC transporter permease [Lichenihabitans sp. Uapishka_5]MDX7953828.1 ABC transporter permease [Lichenihabitans sp. Uapishka_5]